MKLLNGRGILGLAATALFALAAFAGCGGGDSTASEAQPQSKAQFVKQAEAVCTQRHKELQTELTAFQKEVESDGKTYGLGQATEVAEDLMLPSLQAQLEQLEELGPPQGAEAKADAYLKTLESLIAEGEENPKALVSSKLWQRLGSTAKAVGLQECGESF